MTSSRLRRGAERAAEPVAADLLLTPSVQAAQLCVSAFQSNLRIWRSMADSMRESMRSQQDAMLRILIERSAASSATDVGEEREALADTSANGASTFLTPVLAARRAYVQMSGAMMEAQREALAAFVGGDGKPH